MNVIGLTGTIGSGKSTFSEYLREKGYPVVDADRIAKELMQKGQKGYARVIENFSEKILNGEGQIDRKKLSDLVFADEEKLKKLNSIIHPLVIEQVDRQVRRHFHLGEDLIFVDAPLLIEAGMYRITDKVVLIKASTAVLLSRVMQRDNITREKAKLIIDAQMPVSEKEKFADYIIENNGGKDALYAKADALLEELERF